MGEAGQLSITGQETPVMLLDCKKMIEVWNIEDARRMTRHKPFRIKTNAVPHLWRPLPKEWNARDFEYEPGRSKLLHFTILHTQPWQPFPKQLKYEPHALADIWHAMERAADANGFTIFTKARPSSRFREALAAREAVETGEDPAGKKLSQQPGAGTALVRHRKAIDSLIHEPGARSLLVCASRQSGTHGDTDAGEAEMRGFSKLFGDVELSCYDLLTGNSLGENTYDGVIATGPVTWCPDDDVPWVLDAMFARARRFVYVVAGFRGFAGARTGEKMPWLVQDPDWWRSQMACAARRYRGVRWTLCVPHRTWLGTRTNVFTGEGRWMLRRDIGSRTRSALPLPGVSFTRSHPTVTGLLVHPRPAPRAAQGMATGGALKFALKIRPEIDWRACRPPEALTSAMRLGAAVSVLLLLLLLWPGGLRGESDAAPDRLELTYDVYVYGLYAMRWQVVLAQDGSLYELGFRAHPDGPASLLSRVYIDAQAVGRAGDGQIVPLSYHSRYTRRAMRQVRITYGSEGRSLTASAHPSANEEERPEVPAEAVAGAIDPLNGAYALLRDIADTGACHGAMRMFDGRRLFAVELRTDEAAAEEDFATLRCRVELKRIAGFKSKELRKKRFPNSIAIEFAPNGPGGTYLPTRMTVQHRVGLVRIELADVRTSGGKSSAGDTDRPASAAGRAGTRTIP